MLRKSITLHLDFTMKNYVATFTRLPATANFPKAGWPLVPAKEEGGILENNFGGEKSLYGSGW